MPTSPKITINRAPVLTLWAAVVVKRLGFAWDEAVTLGRAVAGLNAYSKGKALGLFQPKPADVKAKRKALKAGEEIQVNLLHRAVPAIRTPDGLRALSEGKPITPESVQRYVESKFGDGYDPVLRAMTTLANSYSPSEIGDQGYKLYEEFRPDVPAGVAGWGAAGVLDVGAILRLRCKAGG